MNGPDGNSPDPAAPGLRASLPTGLWYGSARSRPGDQTAVGRRRQVGNTEFARARLRRDSGPGAPGCGGDWGRRWWSLAVSIVVVGGVEGGFGEGGVGALGLPG